MADLTVGRMNLLASLLFGHLWGDYVLQNKWLALNKSRSTLICGLHCLIYTLVMTVFTWPTLHGWAWSGFIFATHFPIDRFALADVWLAMTRGHTLKGYLRDNDGLFLGHDNAFILTGGFTALVYAVVDNTLHLTLMWYGANWFFLKG